MIQPFLYDYSDAYIIVTGDITVTDIAYRYCYRYFICVTHINDEHIEKAENLDIIMPKYNLLEYSDSYADSSGSLYQFKRDDSPVNNAENPFNIAMDISASFKWKASLLGNTNAADNNNRSLENAKIVVPPKYSSNFFRSLEMPLINCKIHLKLNWNKKCVIYGANAYAGGDNANSRATTFGTESRKLYVPIVTVSSKDNVNLRKHLNEGFKISVYWNEYKSNIESKHAGDNLTRFYLDASFQRVKRLFVLAFKNTVGPNKVQRNSYRKYFLPRVNITNYNVVIDGQNFYDQPINDKSKSMMKLEKLQQDREIITQQDVC